MKLSAETYHPQISAPVAARRLEYAVWILASLIGLVWIGLIVAPPVLIENGNAQLARAIYEPFSYLCHQIGERAFHLHGHSLAVCARCFGVYAGVAAGLLAYPLFRPLSDTTPPPRMILFLAPVPTSIDFALGIFGIWENTHASRFFTAVILGVVCAFFLVPGLIEINRFLWLKNKTRRSFAIQKTNEAAASAPSDYSRPDLRI